MEQTTHLPDSKAFTSHNSSASSRSTYTMRYCPLLGASQFRTTSSLLRTAPSYLPQTRYPAPPRSETSSGGGLSFVNTTMKFFKLAAVNQNTYRQISYINHTKFQNSKVYRLVWQLSLCNLLKPGVKSRMEMQSEQRRQAMLQLHLSDQQFYCLLRCDLYYEIWRYIILPCSSQRTESIPHSF